MRILRESVYNQIIQVLFHLMILWPFLYSSGACAGALGNERCTMKTLLCATLLAATFANPILAGGPDSVWRFQAGASELDGRICDASVEGWRPTGGAPAELNVSYAEGLLTVGLDAPTPLHGAILLVISGDEALAGAHLESFHPHTPGLVFIDSSESADSVVPALRSGSLAVVVRDLARVGIDLPLYAFSLSGSSAAIGKVMACTR